MHCPESRQQTPYPPRQNVGTHVPSAIQVPCSHPGSDVRTHESEPVQHAPSAQNEAEQLSRLLYHSPPAEMHTDCNSIVHAPALQHTPGIGVPQKPGEHPASAK
jgi:hypothetical protein